jgi:hypothetical protein
MPNPFEREARIFDQVLENAIGRSNNLYVAHQFNYENKFFQYKQPTVSSAVGTER